MPDRARDRGHHRYRIRKNGDHWTVYRSMGIFGWWPIVGHSTWSAALATVNRRIRRVRGAQADYALASDGNADD